MSLYNRHFNPRNPPDLPIPDICQRYGCRVVAVPTRHTNLACSTGSLPNASNRRCSTARDLAAKPTTGTTGQRHGLSRLSNLGQGRKLAQACRGRRNARPSERPSPASSGRDTPQPVGGRSQDGGRNQPIKRPRSRWPSPSFRGPPTPMTAMPPWFPSWAGIGERRRAVWRSFGSRCGPVGSLPISATSPSCCTA